MKKNRILKPVLLILLTALFIGSLATPLCVPVHAAKKYHLNRTKTTLYVGDTEKLYLLPATAKENAKIKWSSSKTAVAVVKKGKITAKKSGKATITAKLSGKKYSCKLTVKAPKITYIDDTDDEEDAGNQIYQKDVTREMTKASYWYRKYTGFNKVLLTQSEIALQNQRNYNKAGNSMADLKNIDPGYNGTATKNALATALMNDVRIGRIGDRTTIYRDGEALDTTAMDKWFAEMKQNIESASTSATDTRKYGICVKRADLFMAPTSALVGWSATDADSEFIDSSINVNEPLLIDFVTADKKFYHVISVNCPGWIEADSVAICDTREAWLSQWDIPANEVLVITGSHVTLECSNRAPKTSALDLFLGTQLPLVPAEDIPDNIEERYPWYSYSVYVPTRDENGKMTKEIALISSHHEVTVGYPKMTVKNILKIAFSCLGDRYGWGGMLHAMDCSLFTRNIYRCFGMEIPRNTSWQKNMAAFRIDLSSLSPEEKQQTISGLVPGSLLMFPGHITMYLGTADGKAYVISDLGSLAEADGDIDVKSIYSVSINSLNVRRRNGHTWLEEMAWAICPFIPES